MVCWHLIAADGKVNINRTLILAKFQRSSFTQMGGKEALRRANLRVAKPTDEG